LVKWWSGLWRERDASTSPRAANLTIFERSLNGQPGVVALQDRVTVVVMAFDVEDERIQHNCAVRNPDKPRSWTTVSG
jgi:hypothetical protein